MIFAVLINHWDGRAFGAAGQDLGTGIQVALVQGFAEGGQDAGRLEVLERESGRDRNRQRADEPEALGLEATAEEVPKLQTTQQASRVPSEDSINDGDSGQAAGAFDGAAGTTEAAGGDPLATDDLLSQVARCLPPDYRPVLGFSQLTLTIGPDGRLRAAPEVNSTLPRLSAEDRLAADRIVQAALQCGPYVRPNVLGRVISLAADFSAIGARR